MNVFYLLCQHSVLLNIYYFVISPTRAFFFVLSLGVMFSCSNSNLVDKEQNQFVLLLSFSLR